MPLVSRAQKILGSEEETTQEGTMNTFQDKDGAATKNSDDGEKGYFSQKGEKNDDQLFSEQKDPFLAPLNIEHRTFDRKRVKDFYKGVGDSNFIHRNRIFGPASEKKKTSSSTQSP